MSAEEFGRLGEALDASLAVWERPQFLRWAQGPLQCLVPHDLLVCGMARGDTVQVEQFGFAAPGPPPDRLALALEQWQATERPLFLAVEEAGGGPRDFVLHGLRGADGRIAGFFAFGGLPRPRPARLEYLAEVLLPYLYCTYARVLGHKGERAPAPRWSGQTVTRREAEILGWIREGKTNDAIARILRLSPWTVKNHVQNMLKRLGVQNRAQAVSRALAERLIRH